MTKLVFCVISILYLNFVLSTAEYTNVVQLKNGKIRGLQLTVAKSNQKFEFYQAIKFGTASRFQKPQPAKPWTGVYDATAPGKNCIQFGREVSASPEEATSFSEDCLYLSLYKPIVGIARADNSSQHNASTTTKLDTMVWIYGGAFEMGGIFGQPTTSYDGRYIATMGEVIVVALNYRVGPLGFMSLPSGLVPPNLGLHDQLLGLQWVQKNIAAFGGDPQRVTIFGESAGSMSVASLVLSPLARGLFRRAIAQSGAPSVEAITESVARSHAKTAVFARKLNCSTAESQNSSSTKGDEEKALLKCLLGSSLDQLQRATRGYLSRNEHFIPVYGDELLPLRPAVALKSGNFNHVDFLYGVTRDEGTVFIPQFFPELLATITSSSSSSFQTQTEHSLSSGQNGQHAGSAVELTANTTKAYIIRLMSMYSEKAAYASEVAEYYVDRRLPREPSQEEFRLAVASAWGDSMMVCPTMLYGEELARHSPPESRFYAYRLMQRTPDRRGKGGGGPPRPSWLGVPHGSDQYYLFNYDRTLEVRMENELARFMISSWSSFAKTGRPSGAAAAGKGDWSEAVQSRSSSSSSSSTVNFSTRYMHLEAGHFAMVENYFRETCDQFWRPKIFD